MKTIFETYGTAILASIVVVLMLGILTVIDDGNGHKGIFEIVASNSDFNNELYENMKDTVATLEVYNQTDAPKITLSQPKAVANLSCNLADCFTVKIANKQQSYKLSDCIKNGTSIFGFDVLTITSADDTEMTSLYNKERGTITFPSAGVYTITIKCYDQVNGKITVNSFDFPVDNQ